ncbi:hypothetical protein [Actinomadura nitritigenes]|uniref:hypothetical protein n=1 Tax=Actinomadura nitritigenes TaxID=134602 RepID=UPI003D90684B
MLSRLLAATPWARRSPDGGDNFPDGRRHRFRVGQDVPFEPSTLAIYAIGAAGAVVGRLLVADFDVSRAEASGAADPAGTVAAEAAEFAALVEECGGDVVHDVSPSGGRHVYVKFARPIPFEDLRDFAVALADRFTTLDPAPMRSPSGQIRIAGSPYKREPVEQGDGSFRRTGRLIGFMALTMPLADAAVVLRRPCGLRVWERLQQALAAERPIVDPAPSLSAPLPGVWHLDGQGQPWAPLRGGRRPLPWRLAELARTGAWDDPRLQPENGRRYRSASEARYGVLSSAAAGGWSLAEVTEQARPGGAFAGLDALLGTRSASQRRAVMAHEWQKVVRETATSRTVSTSGRNLHTSSATHPPHSLAYEVTWPVPHALTATPPLSARCHRDLARWQTAVWLAERDPVRCKGWGRRAPSARVVLRALALAARLSSDTTTAFGCRSLALMSGLSWRTVAVVLADLRDEHDPLVDLVERGRERDADRYTLRIPDAYRAETTRTVLQAGRIETGHPVWLGLQAGTVCALLYETLTAIEARSVDLQRRAVLSATAVADALNELGAHGLAVRGPDGWRRGDRTLDQVAAEVNGFDRYAERVADYRAHRADWHSFLESVRPLAAAFTDLEAALAEHDRYIPDDNIAPDLDTELHAVLTDTAPPKVQPAGRTQHDPDEASPSATPVAMPAGIPVPAPSPAPDDQIDHTIGQRPSRAGRNSAASTEHDQKEAGDAPETAAEPPNEGASSPPSSPTPSPPPVREIITQHNAAHEDAARRNAPLARRLLAARDAAERERILAEMT